jgi:hydrogenase maturation protease
VKRIVIAGIGNVLLGDDGLGPYSIEQLTAQYDFGPAVELVDAGTPALDFSLYFANADLLILIDAIKSTAPPGTLLRYSREEILRQSAPLRVDAHSPALGHALMFGEFADASPNEVWLMGAATGNTEPGTQLTDAVRASVPALLEMVADTVRRQGVRADRLSVPRAARIWWEQAA